MRFWLPGAPHISLALWNALNHWSHGSGSVQYGETAIPSASMSS